MNILYTAYYGLGIGGAEVSMALLARKMKENHNIIMASSENYNGFKTYRFNKYIKYIPSLKLQDKCLANFFSKIIKEENIKIIHSHDSKTAVAAIMAAKKNNIKAITHYRDYWFCCPRSSLLKPDLSSCENCNAENLKACSRKTKLLWDRQKLSYLNRIRNLLKSADAKIAISNAISKKLEMIGIDDARIIANGINLKDFTDSRPKLNLGFRNATIGYIGSLEYNKGIQNISKIIKELLENHKELKFVIIGMGKLRKKLIDEYKDYKHRVIFEGKLNYFDAIKAYYDLDIVLIPSIWQEPFSRVAIEAMSAGKPIIASNVGGLKDIIKKDFGLLVEPNNADEWKNAIEMMIEKPIKRKLMGINAEKEAKKYDINKITNQVESIYGELNEKNSASVP